jgi:hypothetical protein
MKYNLLIAAIFLSIIIYANVDEMHGIVGLTKRDGGLGCVCHNINPTDSVLVWIEGPDTVLINDTADFKLFMTGGPAVAGGLNVASYFGELDSVDTLTHTILGELTHSFPNPFVNDTVYWNFRYVAPDNILTDTLYSVANSVNGDSIPSEFDQWNFGNNFIINVIDQPTGSIDKIILPAQFVLEQNYPNPFNPTTMLSFVISQSSFVSLKVFDVIGKEMATLINEEKPAGNYEIQFDASGLSSGIYYYRLEANGYSKTNKMVLLK